MRYIILTDNSNHSPLGPFYLMVCSTAVVAVPIWCQSGATRLSSECTVNTRFLFAVYKEGRFRKGWEFYWPPFVTVCFSWRALIRVVAVVMELLSGIKLNTDVMQPFTRLHLVEVERYFRKTVIFQSLFRGHGLSNSTWRWIQQMCINI